MKTLFAFMLAVSLVTAYVWAEESAQACNYRISTIKLYEGTTCGGPYTGKSLYDVTTTRTNYISSGATTITDWVASVTSTSTSVVGLKTVTTATYRYTARTPRIVTSTSILVVAATACVDSCATLNTASVVQTVSQSLRTAGTISSKTTSLDTSSKVAASTSPDTAIKASATVSPNPTAQPIAALRKRGIVCPYTICDETLWYIYSTSATVPATVVHTPATTTVTTVTTSTNPNVTQTKYLDIIATTTITSTMVFVATSTSCIACNNPTKVTTPSRSAGTSCPIRTITAMPTCTIGYSTIVLTTTNCR